VAGNRNGQIFNVNADQMAAGCAAGFQADRLLFLTDVDGVKGKDGLIPLLTPAGCGQLIREGIATGGMQAKLNAACEGLAKGVGEVVIVPGARPSVVADVLRGQAIGTRLIRD
jgi:acetylglutamate kinase